MNINQQVTELLERFVAEGPKAVEAVLLDGESQGYIVGVNNGDDRASVSITVRDFDRYSLNLRRLEVTQPGAATLDLAGYAGQIAGRLTYLEEPLALIEIDAVEDAAILRSEPPHQTGDEIAYWEAVVHTLPEPHVRLARYRWSPHQPQREVGHQPLTFGTVGRLAADIALSLTIPEAKK
ncbi:MAG: hypothetical protein KDF65_02955 [Anaerolineae bacterium]|nr:hypothetical protein [Anaerolineae bacterium]